MQVGIRLPRFGAAFLIAAVICLAGLVAAPAAWAQTQVVFGPSNGSLQQSGDDADASNIGEYYEIGAPTDIPILVFSLFVNGTAVDSAAYWAYVPPPVQKKGFNYLSDDPNNPTNIPISWLYPLPTGSDTVEFKCVSYPSGAGGPYFDLTSDMDGSAAMTPRFDPALEAPGYGLTLP